MRWGVSKQIAPNYSCESRVWVKSPFIFKTHAQMWWALEHTGVWGLQMSRLPIQSPKILYRLPKTPLTGVVFFPVTVSTPSHHSHSFSLFLPQLMLASFISISISKCMKSLNALMETRWKQGVPAFPNILLKSNRCSFLQTVIHLHVDRQDEQERWGHLWRRSGKNSWHDYLYSRFTTENTLHFYFFKTAWNSEDAFLLD